MLVGVVGKEAWLELLKLDCVTVCSMMLSALEDVDEKLPLFPTRDMVDGSVIDPTGVAVGDVGWERLLMAIIAVVASRFCLAFISCFAASTFALSVLTTGLAADANECARIILGGFCTLEEDAVSVVSTRV